jgi:ribulose 1,5-bisphosphate synthetase/thiazole synthase
MIDESILARVIIERYSEKFLPCLELDAAVCGTGPSGLAAAYYPAKKGLKLQHLKENFLSAAGCFCPVRRWHI